MSRPLCRRVDELRCQLPPGHEGAHNFGFYRLTEEGDAPPEAPPHPEGEAGTGEAWDELRMALEHDKPAKAFAILSAALAQARAEAFEEAARIVCHQCGLGRPRGETGHGKTKHLPKPGGDILLPVWECAADELWERAARARSQR